MIVKKELSLPNSRSSVYSYEEPEKCPLCKHAIKPQPLHVGLYSDNQNKTFLTALYLCKHCYRSFVTLATTNPGNHTDPQALLYCGPSKHEEKEFSQDLTALSPRFVKIYNQALAAEDAGLDQICGIGYRKALEFLIKDYLIHKEPDAKETIEKMELGNCIANKIDDGDLRAVAQRCAWLGNDEAHFYRKHEEYSLDDLKRLLDAAVYWVSMKLTTEFALEIEKKS